MENLKDWLSQIVCFLCLMTVLLHVIPDTSLKKYVRFFLGILFILVVAEPLGVIFGTDEFFLRMETEALRQMQQDFETGKQGLAELENDWDEEEYEKELEKKIEEIRSTYHIPGEELHNNNQKAGVEDGKT